MKNNTEDIAPKLYIHVGQATHFLRWEIPEFCKYFTLVDHPSNDAILLTFGPDVLEAALSLPAKHRYAVLFPGFGHNPLYNLEQRRLHKNLIRKYDKVFINPGPLEIAYKGLKNIVEYPFSVDVDSIPFRRPRKKLKNIIHISSDYPQKDWKRSLEIMQKTGLSWKVFPKRTPLNKIEVTIRNTRKMVYSVLKTDLFKLPPEGYVDHKKVIKEYAKSDAFVHVARDIKSEVYIDGKYTATLIEAGLSGCIVFWHDTLSLGNTLETVFELPLDPQEAAEKIQTICANLDIKEHSRKTHEEMKSKFNPQVSVAIRAKAILNDAKVR